MVISRNAARIRMSFQQTQYQSDADLLRVSKFSLKGRWTLLAVAELTVAEILGEHAP